MTDADPTPPKKEAGRLALNLDTPQAARARAAAAEASRNRGSNRRGIDTTGMYAQTTAGGTESDAAQAVQRAVLDDAEAGQRS